jgi:hypothetical protein
MVFPFIASSFKCEAIAFQDALLIVVYFAVLSVLSSKAIVK